MQEQLFVVSMKQLLECGVHFGHATKRWNPKMAKYIYTKRNGIHIIDLQKSAEQIEIAYKALLDIAKEGKKVLFIGTKKQAQNVIKEEALRAEQFYVNQRWLGGTLTNFKTIRKRVNKLQQINKQYESGYLNNLPKKEVSKILKQKDKLEHTLGGIVNMTSLPGALFIIDPKKEENAIKEARKLNIPVFGIVDTNCDPDLVDYVIPANDDAIRAVKLISSIMANACIEANGGEVQKYTLEDLSFESAKQDHLKEKEASKE